MRTFIIIWLGQAVSMIGSSMTAFAFTLWVWELTRHATDIALFGFFRQVPQVLITPIAGVIVDRWNRKYLMMLGDTMSALLTTIVLLLYLTHSLQLWHLYLAVAVEGIFVQIQELAYSASISMIVPKQQYSRVCSIGFLANSSSVIIAPALAGVLYVVIGLVGILIIDIATCVIAVSALMLVRIPQPTTAQAGAQSHANLKQELYFGWHYITARPGLLAMLVLTSLFWFTYYFGSSLSSTLILARSGNDAKVLGPVTSAAGLGGIIGALLVSTWGGFKRRIHGVLLGMVGTGLSQTVFGLGIIPLIWIPAKFCSSLNFPILGSADEAIWLRKVRPNVQGRVLSTRYLVERGASTVAYLIAGPLADYVFEPVMMSGGSLAPILGWIFGTGKGAGMALLYVISSLGLLLIGLSGYAFRTLRDVEIIVPDHDIQC